MTNSQKKDRLIQNALTVSRENKKSMSKESRVLQDFLGAFYKYVPADDLADWKAEEISTVAKSMCDFGHQRKAEMHKIRVFTPENKRDGWHVPYTVLQLVNDDMPFIIDSIVSELNTHNLNIDVLFHPILIVERDKNGALQKIHPDKLTDVKASDVRPVPESYVYIQLEQMLSAEACLKLEETLHNTMQNVRMATNDWRHMLARIEAALDFAPSFEKMHDPENLKEAQDFLAYVKNNNFTFLGYREYSFSGTNGDTQSTVVAESELGILKGGEPLHFGQGIDSPEVAALESAEWPVMVSKLIDYSSPVHRRVPMDALSVKILDEDGNLMGMHLFVGLFTSSTYSCRTSEVPIVRQKVRATVSRASFARGSHDHKALEHIMEKMPRDELFHVSTDRLYNLSLGILRLQIKQRIALFAHMDPMGQYMSCLLYVPRDRYNTKFRLLASRILEGSLKGRVVNYFTTLDDSLLARVLFTVRFDDGAPEDYDIESLESQLMDLAREWDERLKRVLVEVYGKMKGAELAYIYGRAFGSAYHESIQIGNAVHDIRQLETMIHNEAPSDIRIEFYQLQEATAGEVRLKVYHEAMPVPLSDILPVLANMGLEALSEMPYEVHPQGYDGVIWIHDFVLKGPADIALEEVKENLEETFRRVWAGHAENDGLNQLVLRANLSWREIMILRTFSCFMRQARFPYSRPYIEQVLNAYPQIVQKIVELFETRHNPKLAEKAVAKSRRISQKILEMLQDVQKLDHDRILRAFKTLIEQTLRTSYYQVDDKGAPKSYLAVKLDSKNILDLPLPRPHVEIFVYSSRFEAVHLRGGEIARGGIRWSDRLDDFRTEVLGLMKSQMVKNTVIVPVGSKGGFVLKQPPKTGGRDAFQQEGIACYKIFMKALLDLTDNNAKGKILRPKGVVCHDDVDPYLVVAADKGTASFSDIANSVSLEAGFWLGDAFASGGSAGYDHKEMGITARGGWESVKRHFREMGKDIQKEPFTAVGVGDMSGDVFGNGVLLSKQMQLQGAFNHLHIFCDPNPDIAGSFAERQRLFKARGGWDAYDKSKLSSGGAIFERSAKTLKLSAAIRKCFDIKEEEVTPDELIQAILKAKVELIWFGGIGTYMKSVRQSQADADDKGNDSLRVDATEVRAQVIGEGANLGTTQLSRIEYARNGGRINTDFIDNSAGVDCSDHEVNIKILLSDVVAKGKLKLEQRNKLLETMTKEVATLVLRDNYQQTQSLSFQEHLAKAHLGLHSDLMKALEKAGLLKRSLEGLPDEEAMSRLGRDGQGLTRPELAILTSFSKIMIYNEVLKSTIPDDPMMESLLFDYFPKELHKYATEIKAHKLRREIIATQIVNTLVNRMGPEFVQSRMSKTGAAAAEVIKAFMIVLHAYDLPQMWAEIEALDNKVHSKVQTSALNQVFQVAKRTVTWYLRFGGNDLDVAVEIEAFKPGIDLLKKSIGAMAPEEVHREVLTAEENLTKSGVPEALAAEISTIKLLSAASDIISITRRSEGEIKSIAAVYFTVGDSLGLDWLRYCVGALVPANAWQARVMGGLTDDFYIHQAALTSAIIGTAKKNAKPDRALIDKWFEENNDRTEKITQMVAEFKALPKVDLDMLVLVSQRIGQLVHQAR